MQLLFPAAERAQAVPAPAKKADTICVLAADGAISSDDEAIKIFLESYARHSKHTQRAYRKEVLRFWLWLVSRRGLAHASLFPGVSVADVNAYLDQLTDPRPIDASILELAGMTRQPFRRGLVPASIQHAITVLSSFFNAMRNLPTPQGTPYCLFNPFLMAHAGAGSSAKEDEVEQALHKEEWNAVQATIEALPRETDRDRRHYHRTRWIFALLYRAFLRRNEAAKLRMENFQLGPDGWTIRLTGKGVKKARIIMTHRLVEEMRLYRQAMELAPLPAPRERLPAILPVTEIKRSATGEAMCLSDQVIYLVCREIFTAAATRFADSSASALRLTQATSHWIRHTGVSHAMEAGIDPRYVQAQARHSSLKMTARYDHKERRRWRAEFERF